MSSQTNWDELAQDNANFLSRIIRFDTTNPPGDEAECLRWIQDYLKEDGIESQLLESGPGRGNLIARLKASGEPEGGALLLMAHVDVVPAPAAGWSQPPFSGAVSDGQVWGRGALDMKGTAATWTTLFRHLSRQPLRRDVVLMLNADEETGGALGAGWVAENHWDLIDCEVALNEGGGAPVSVDGNLFYTYSTDEKRPARFRMTARGTPGHGSVPKEDNALIYLAKAILAVGTTRLPVQANPVFEACIRTVAGRLPAPKGDMLLRALDPAEADAILDAVFTDTDLRERIRAIARDTLTPTMLQAGEKVNSIPGTATCWVDCRVMPGSGVDEVRPRIEALLERHGVAEHITLEFEARPDFPPSPVDHSLMESFRESLARNAPEAAGLLPILGSGATDSRYIRPHGVAAYGFYPLLPSVDRTGVHAVNERVSLEQIGWATRVVGEALTDFCVR